MPLTWPDLTQRPRPRPTASLPYGPAPLQSIDIWRPGHGSPRGTVLMVHGGCWQSDIADRRLMDWLCDDLRARGIAVWNIDYRGVDREGGGWPGTFADVAAAADALRSLGPAHGLNRQPSVAVGHSAGGHLALWLAGRRALPANSALWCADPLPIARVISLGGLPDLAAVAACPENGCGTDVIARLTGEPSAERPDVFAETSAARLLPLGVPVELVNGLDDRIVPLRLGRAFAAQLGAGGERVRLHELAETGHVELVAPESAAWALTARLIEEAL